MKIIKLWTLLFLLFCAQAIIGQDSLFSVDLAPHVYHFNLEEGRITGEGAAFLETEIKNNQYFLIGEYHGSKHISNFTKAVIPLLEKADYHTMALEVGPVSVEYLRNFSQNPKATASQLAAFMDKYKFTDADGDEDYAMPFFDQAEDAAFLAQAASYKWNLLGLDQEYYFCFIPLIEKMYHNLSQKDQSILSDSYAALKDTLAYFYKLDDTDSKSLMLSLRDSKLFNDFIHKAAGKEENKQIKEAIEKTIEIYGYNISRKYLECNATRIDYMKANLSKQLNIYGFDYSKDKMLVKMGGVHTAKGYSWLSLYEIGNTLHELAAFNGNSSVHLTFFNRYYKEKGKEIDDLDDPKGYASRYKDLLQFGQKDKWTIIDWRPLKSKVFYSRKYDLPKVVIETMKQHDLMLIPPMEIYE